MRPSSEDRDPVGQGGDLRKVVRGEQHGRPLRRDPADQVADEQCTGRIERSAGLVEQQHSWSPEQCHGDTEALAHPSGEAVRRPARGIGEAHPVEQAVHVPEVGSTEPGIESHRVARRNSFGERDPLREIPEPRAGRRTERDIHSVHEDPSRARPHQPNRRFEGGALAGAVRSDQRQHLARPDLQVEALDGEHPAIGLPKALVSDHRVDSCRERWGTRGAESTTLGTPKTGNASSAQERAFAASVPPYTSRAGREAASMRKGSPAA